MANPSNLYAEKVFAEHPTVLWALDDTSDYLSLISESQRDLSDTNYWSISGGSVEQSLDLIGSPFGDSHLSKITPENSETAVSVTFNSSVIFSTDDLNQNMGTFNVGAYFYSLSPFIQSIELGYSYVDNSETIEVTHSFPTEIQNSWVFASYTFTPPTGSYDISLVLRANYFIATEENPEYGIYVNGLTLGQWSEEFNATSLGIEKTLISETIALDADYGIPATAYGLQDKNGYYLVSDTNQIMAKNTGMPLVFGASNNTSLLPNNNLPSLILPGQGFMNEAGAYKTFTFEAWLRINAGSDNLRKIIGPITSNDGVYVQGGYLYFRIGEYFKSYFVGEWYRPMLLQIRLMTSSVSLLLNGEQIMLIEFTDGQPTFASKLNEFGEDQDWIGFYSYDDLFPFEIDCVAIYSYNVPNVVAKRRWVYGQAVESPETINSAFSGTSFFADYQMANYTKNLAYPDLARWDNGIVENLNTDNGILSTPTYPLPKIIFREIVEEELTLPEQSDAVLSELLIADNNDSELQTDSDGLFISCYPNINWANYRSYIYFENINFLNEQPAGAYVTFKELEDSASEQTLMTLKNKYSQEYIRVAIDSESIKYIYKSATADEEVITEIDKYSAGTLFSVGFDFAKIRSFFGGTISKMIADAQALELYINNFTEFDSQFTGNIYTVNLANRRNLNEVSDYFGTNGLISSDVIDFEDLVSHKATYSVKPRVLFDNFDFDIDLKSSWQDYSPLSYFAQTYKDAQGRSAYGLDFIQLNINYPNQPYLVDGETVTSEVVKTYITFQPLLGGANTDYRDYSEVVPISGNNVVIPGNDWVSKKFEVRNNTVIYPPAGINVRNFAIVYHIDIFAQNVLSDTLRIRKLELASQVFNSSSPKSIGTRLGNDVFPYKKSGIYFDYKSYNPFTIYKGSTPYLYLTADSGFRPVGDFANTQSRGISIPINKELAESYKLAAMQMSIKFDGDIFPTTPVQIAEVQHRNGTISMFIVSDHPSGKRGRLYAINAGTGRIENKLLFYWNGMLTKYPMLDIKQWGMLGVSFAAKLDFASFAGAIRINGPMTYNNISHYELTDLQQAQEINQRPWLRVKYIENQIAEWEYWADSFIWEDVLVLAIESRYGANPRDIYSAYVGTNKIVSGDDSILSIIDYEYPVYGDVDLESIAIKPV